MKTNRGFEIQFFKDDYGVECSIQESGSVEPHLWLGIAHNDVKVMKKDKEELLESVKNLTLDHPECNEYGWCTVALPKDAFVEKRMHITRRQAKELARKLNFFAKYGFLKEEEL